jgi:hypothetical protein
MAALGWSGSSNGESGTQMRQALQPIRLADPASHWMADFAAHLLQCGAWLHLEAHPRAADGTLVIPLVGSGQGVDAVGAHIPARTVGEVG